jgi:hypothetical protein
VPNDNEVPENNSVKGTRNKSDKEIYFFLFNQFRANLGKSHFIIHVDHFNLHVHKCIQQHECSSERYGVRYCLQNA